MTAQAGRAWIRPLFNGSNRLDAFKYRFPDKFSSNSKEGSIFRSIFVALGIIILFGVHTAVAQSAPGWSFQASSSYCKPYNLPGPTFLNLLNIIVKHGDLTDVPFVEKTLGTKFSQSFGTNPDGSPDPNNLIYQSNQVFGNPIAVYLSINTGYDITESHGLVAKAGFDPVVANYDVPSFFMSCLKLTANELYSKFGPEIYYSTTVPPSEMVIAGEKQNYPGNNNAKLQLIFSLISADFLSIGRLYPGLSVPDAAVADFQIKQWQ